MDERILKNTLVNLFAPLNEEEKRKSAVESITKLLMQSYKSYLTPGNSQTPEEGEKQKRRKMEEKKLIEDIKFQVIKSIIGKIKDKGPTLVTDKIRSDFLLQREAMSEKIRDTSSTMEARAIKYVMADISDVSDKIKLQSDIETSKIGKIERHREENETFLEKLSNFLKGRPKERNKKTSTSINTDNVPNIEANNNRRPMGIPVLDQNIQSTTNNANNQNNVLKKPVNVPGFEQVHPIGTIVYIKGRRYRQTADGLESMTDPHEER